MNRNHVIKISCILLLPLTALINKLSHENPDLTEKIYSKGVFRTVSLVFSNIFGILKFSVIEIYIFLLLLIMITALLKIIASEKNKAGKNKFPGLVGLVLTAAAAVSVIYFLFIFSWGLSYNRHDAFRIFGFERREITLQRLTDTGLEFRDRLNELSGLVSDDDFSIDNVIGRGNIGYYALQDNYPELGGNYPGVKPVKASIILSYLNIWGFYSPFSYEANINTMIPGVMLPSTIAHELAHIRGFAREDEANFIAYLTCINHSDPAYIYSGYLLAFMNISGAIAQTDRDAYDTLIQSLDQKVIGHMREIRDFNLKYRGILDRISTRINDLFLKTNRQADGILSYGRMTDLIIASRGES